MIRQYIPKESLSLKKERRYSVIRHDISYNDKKLFFEEGEVINCETRRYTEIKHVSEEEVTLNMIRHGILK